MAGFTGAGSAGSPVGPSGKNLNWALGQASAVRLGGAGRPSGIGLRQELALAVLHGLKGAPD